LFCVYQEQFGGWNNKEAVLKAANHAEEMHHNCIKNQQNFIFKEERIKIRTLKGGHTVPAEKIKSTTINTGLFFRILSCLRGFL
jgi:predicted ABC-type ATPase